MAKVQEIGPYSAYAIAVKYGYKGTEEEWVQEQEANRKAAEAAAAAAEQSAKNAAATASNVTQSGQQAVQNIQNAQTTALQAIDTAKQQAVQAAQAEAEKAATSAGQAASSAAEAAQSATNAAAEVGKVQNAGTTAVQAVQAAQSTATEAVSAAQQTATQAVLQAQTAAVSAVQEAGTTQTSAVASAASSALSGIADAKDAALSDVAQAGAEQVSAVGTAGTSAVQDVNDAKKAALEEIDAANAALPSPTQSDAGKVPTVKADGSAYELAGPYAPLSAAIRPTASGNPVSITDSVEWPLQGLKVYGKSTQVTTTGAQLFDITDYVVSSQIENSALKFACHLVIGERYAIKANTTTQIKFKVSTSITGYTSVSLNNIQNGDTFVMARNENIPENETQYLFFFIPNDPVATNGVNDITQIKDFNIMINAGSTVKPWEPYTGGKPSPSPEYPQEIVSAGDDGSIDLTVSNGASLSQSMTIATPNGVPGIPVDWGGNYTDADGQQWVCDEIDYARGVYVQRVEQLELDGSSDEIYNLHAVNSYNIANFLLVNHSEYTTRTFKTFCNRLVRQITLIEETTTEGYYLNNANGIYIRLQSSKASAVPEFRNWLNQNPIKLLYILETPTETPLSEEEIAAYRALHTYDGATVVSTAEDVAGLDVRYVADAQKYIDNRLTAAESHIQEIAAAQLNAQTGG